MKVPPDIVKFPSTFNVTALELPLASVILNVPPSSEKLPPTSKFDAPEFVLTVIAPPV